MIARLIEPTSKQNSLLYLDAIRSAGRAVRQSSQALRASAWDYLNTEDQATELINRGIGRALGELS